MESTKLMRWLWGEDQGGRISLYEPQREVVLSSLCLPLPSGKTRRFVGKGMLLPLYCAGAKTRRRMK